MELSLHDGVQLSNPTLTYLKFENMLKTFRPQVI